MNPVALTVEALAKRYGRTRLFHGLSFTAQRGELTMVRGRNGAGKSTLLRIVAGLERQAAGECWLRADNGQWLTRDKREWIGMCAPDIHIYEELTAWENLQLFHRLQKRPFSDSGAAALLDEARLLHHQHKQMAVASSGMRQRLKLIVATLHQPPLLLLDEPESNLDADGLQFLYRLIAAGRTHGTVLLATNDPLADLQPDRTITIGI